jgi:hypothetical protein
MAKIVTESDFFRVLKNSFPKYFVSVEHEAEAGPAAYAVVLEVGPVMYDATGASLLDCFETLLNVIGV